MAKCAGCGTTENLTKDHITPKSQGGTNDRSNIQKLCRSCNQLKADGSMAWLLYRLRKKNEASNKFSKFYKKLNKRT